MLQNVTGHVNSEKVVANLLPAIIFPGNLFVAFHTSWIALLPLKLYLVNITSERIQ